MKAPISSKSDALVLRSRVYGESDKILTFLTRDFGKLSAIAKGALRSKRRFVNSLEPMARIHLGFRPGRGDLAWIESAEIRRPCRNAVRDLERYAWSTYVLEVVDCMVEGREAEPALFDLTESVLARIDSSFPEPLDRSWLRAFEAGLLQQCGLDPRLETCAGCGRPAAGTMRFRPQVGTITCSDCSDGTGIEVSVSALDSIRHLRKGFPVADETAGEVRVILQTAISHHARRPLRSPALLREIVSS